MVIIQTETLRSLGVLTFACIYYCELKNRISREVIFTMTSFWKFWVYTFQPQSKNKKKTVDSGDIWLMFLSRSTERQAGHDEKSYYWLILKKVELTNIFLLFFFFFYFILRKFEFFAYVACTYFCECYLKENFGGFNFAKSTQIHEIHEKIYTWRLAGLR